jgi:hypothetical protein
MLVRLAVSEAGGFNLLVGSRETIKSRPSHLDPYLLVSPHTAPDVLGFRLAHVLVIMATLVNGF